MYSVNNQLLAVELDYIPIPLLDLVMQLWTINPVYVRVQFTACQWHYWEQLRVEILMCH